MMEIAASYVNCAGFYDSLYFYVVQVSFKPVQSSLGLRYAW